MKRLASLVSFVSFVSSVSFVSVALSVSCAKNIPPPEVKVSSDEATLAKGKYLTTAMGCTTCHSQRDWTKLSGPPVPGTELAGHPDVSKDDGFPPSFQFGAPNLTPANLQEWTDGEIVRATILGQNKKGEGLFPLMPYREWRDHVALDDAAAVVSYLRTVPPTPGKPMPERKFPIPGFVMNGFPEDRVLRPTAPKPGDADYGQYVAYRSACMACHTSVDARGKFTGTPFAGGRMFPLPQPAGGAVWSANLTPDEESGLGKWTKEMFIGRFRQTNAEAARAVTVNKGDFQTIMPWWAYAELTDEDLGALFDFLKALPAKKNVVVKHSPTLPEMPK